MPIAIAAGHSNREIVFQIRGKDKSKKELFFIDQPCLRDAISELGLEIVRPRNLEVG